MKTTQRLFEATDDGVDNFTSGALVASPTPRRRYLVIKEAHL
jgi:hypothetical protein